MLLLLCFYVFTSSDWTTLDPVRARQAPHCWAIPQPQLEYNSQICIISTTTQLKKKTTSITPKRNRIPMISFSSLLLHTNIRLSQHHLLKSYLFPLTCQDILSKVSWSYIWRFIVGLSGLYTNQSILLVPRCTVFLSGYMINSKSGNVNPPNFVTLQGCLFAILSSQELQSQPVNCCPKQTVKRQRF